LGAPGDFALLAKKDWFSLRGYPELPIYSLQLDCVFSHIANHNGISEEVLEDPMRIYHVEHEPGMFTMWQMKERLDAAGIPALDPSQYLSWVIRIYKEHGPVVVNGPDWGLGNEQLDEITIQDNPKQTDLSSSLMAPTEIGTKLTSIRTDYESCIRRTRPRRRLLGG
jgi:hypothetical protein